MWVLILYPLSLYHFCQDPKYRKKDLAKHANVSMQTERKVHLFNCYIFICLFNHVQWTLFLQQWTIFLQPLMTNNFTRVLLKHLAVTKASFAQDEFSTSYKLSASLVGKTWDDSLHFSTSAYFY